MKEIVMGIWLAPQEQIVNALERGVICAGVVSVIFIIGVFFYCRLMTK